MKGEDIGVIEDNRVNYTLFHIKDAADEGRYSRGVQQDADILRISLERTNDNQLSELKTIPVLCRPEFLQGKLKADTTAQVKRAIAASLQCRQMCAEWGKLAISSGKKSQINDKILNWWQEEFVPAGPDHSKSGFVPSQSNGDQITDRNEKSAALNTLSSTQASLGSMLRKMFCCCSSMDQDHVSETSSRKNAQIFVKKLDGTIFSLSMSAEKPKGPETAKDSDLVFTESVRALMEKIHDVKSIHPDQQFLVFQNKPLEEKKLLCEYGILPQSMLYLIQLRSVLGVDESVRVTATGNGDLAFTEEKFRGLYRWYRDGQQRPDVYMGEFLNGILLVFGNFYLL